MKFRELLILAGGVAAAAQASALSLGNSQGHVQLGSPIDLVFPVQPDAGKTADSSCITADVWMGDAALASSQITLIPQSNAVRLRSKAAVYEPLVTVKLHAGCAGSISRSYTFFADPPRSMAASVEPIDLNKIQLSTATVAAQALPPSAPSQKKPRVAKRPAPAKASTPKAPAIAATVAAAAPAAAVAAPPPPEPLATPKESTEHVPVSSAGEQPRLRVEPIERLEQSPQDVDSPRPSSTAIDPNTKMVLDANAARLEAMEKQLQALQTQLTNNRTEIAGLQTQLVQAQNQDLPAWVNIMLALLALAAAAIAWLLLRLKQERQRAQRAWADTLLAVDDSEQATTIDTHAQSGTPPSAPAPVKPEPAPVQPVTTAPSEAASFATTVPPSTPDSSAWETTAEAHTPPPMPEELYAEFEQLSTGTPPANDTSAIAEVLTAQALFDVQEQAEFYASIGENDQAIEILQSHIAQHETSSPLAYIELLQLLYRLSRTEAFEQARQQFQTHFNVNAPEFMGFSRKGHDLWSGYPDVLGQIEAQWPTDDVQALLRSFIVRQPNRPPSNSDIRFDLPAFDDLLMLYNVAQTTPASSRGKLPGRIRTAPTEVPLPELVFESAPSASASSFTSTAMSSFNLDDTSLDMLNTVNTPAPLAPEQPLGDSPFQGPAHFAPDETLVEDLTLDWDMSAPSGAVSPAASTPSEVETPLDLGDLDIEFTNFSMDERDLPPKTQH